MQEQEGVSSIGNLVDSNTGDVIVQMFGPPRPAGRGDLSGALYALSELLIRGYEIDGMHGGLGGPFSWGVDFENDVFLIVPDYQDAECNCGFRDRADQWHEANDHEFRCPHRVPNFWHKRTGIEVRWYKSIGRDMKIAPEETTGETLAAAIREAFESIPEEIRNKAQQDHDAEHTPEAEEETATHHIQMFTAIQRMHDSMTPCWGCSDAGQLMPLKDGKNGRTGTFSAGVGRTVHDDSGACVNCGHVNTPRQTARLVQRDQQDIESLRKHWDALGV